MRRIEAWTGPSALVITELEHAYELGELLPGNYKFTFKAWGEGIEVKTFSIFKSTRLKIDPSTLIGGIIAALAVIAISVAMFYKRRRAR